MKTNVSIKFNSIEEYREIEKKLKEMGYKKDGNWFMENIIRVGFGAVRIYDNKKFSGLISLRFGSLSKHYNSLEEFLKDQVMKVNKFNTWRKRLYRCSIYRNNWNNLSIKNKKLNNHGYHYDI